MRKLRAEDDNNTNALPKVLNKAAYLDAKPM